MADNQNSDVEFIECEIELKRLRDVQAITSKPLVINASESQLKTLSCPVAFGDRILELNARSCRLTSLMGLSNLPNLKKLNVGQNVLTVISSERDDCKAPNLNELLADGNQIGSENQGILRGLSFVGFPLLVYLDLSNNCIETLDFALTLGNRLKVFKFSNNKIDNICEFHYLYRLSNLEEIEFNGNTCTDSLTDNKLLVVVKAIIVGKLTSVNGIHINERQELQAEHLHVSGIRKFKPDASEHDKMVIFVNETLNKMNEKQLKTMSDKRNCSPLVRATSTNQISRLKTPRELRTTPLRKVIETPQYDQNNRVENQISDEEDIQQNIQSTSSSHSNQNKLDQLFSMITSLQQEMSFLKSENASQWSKISWLETENESLRQTVVNQNFQLSYLEDQLSIVPTNMRLLKRNCKDPLDEQYYLEWDNHLKAMSNVKKYEFTLEGEHPFNVAAPNRRALLVGPIFGQTVSMKVIHNKSNNKSSEVLEFTLNPPLNKFEAREDKENRI